MNKCSNKWEGADTIRRCSVKKNTQKGVHLLLHEMVAFNLYLKRRLRYRCFYVNIAKF